MSILYSVVENKLKAGCETSENVTFVVEDCYGNPHYFPLNKNEYGELKNIVADVLRVYFKISNNDFRSNVEALNKISFNNPNSSLGLEELRKQMTTFVYKISNGKIHTSNYPKNMSQPIRNEYMVNPTQSTYIHPMQLEPLFLHKVMSEQRYKGYKQDNEQSVRNNSEKIYIKIYKFDVELTLNYGGNYSITRVTNPNGIELPIDEVINSWKKDLIELTPKIETEEEILRIVKNNIKHLLKMRKSKSKVSVHRDYKNINKYYIISDNGTLTIEIIDNSVIINDMKHNTEVTRNLIDKIENLIEKILNIEV